MSWSAFQLPPDAQSRMSMHEKLLAKTAVDEPQAQHVQTEQIDLDEAEKNERKINKLVAVLRKESQHAGS